MRRIGIGKVIAAITSLAVAIAGGAVAQQPDSATSHSRPPADCNACVTGPRAGLPPLAAFRPQQDTGRPRAIEYGEGYSVRLKIHLIASYPEIPLFIAEYFVGRKVLTDEQANPGERSSLRGTHGALATGLELLFAVNTVTGGWNLIESRHDPAGRTRRWIHSISMLAADAGFAASAATARSARGGGTSASQHQGLAIGSMAIATASTLMMWLWKD